MIPWAAGMQIGPYLLAGPIGSGGMGEVWKARDARLDRIVAIKRLKSQHTARFEQEARAIAALNHAHICQIYDVGPDYLVMEYIEGRSPEGPLPVDAALKLAAQIADALTEAHSRGILHRDLKPANILVTAKGAAKLLDFGIAKLTADSDATQTMAGSVMGTPLYMSPEQVEGKALDARSDIFSFGAVLYEVLGGSRAFNSLGAVLRDEPASLKAPDEIARIVMRCLRKAPADRFQSMDEVKAALERVTAKPPDQQPSIAVLPFANMSRDADDEYFSDGLAEEIINALTQVAGLKVIARTSAFAFKGKNEDIRKIAETLGVTNVLEGSVRRGGSRIRVTAQLIHAADGTHLWSQRYDREMTDAFAIQDEISVAIADQLKVRLTGHKRSAINPEAYQAYLEGKHYMLEMTPTGMAKSLECFERSIRLDPNYADPWAALGQRALLQAMNMGARPRAVIPASLAAVSRALELNPDAAEAYYVRGMVQLFYERDWRAAGEDLTRAIELNPALAHAHMGRSVYLLIQRRNEEALAEIRRALELDPLSISSRRLELLVLGMAGAGALAVERARVLIDLFGGSWISLLNAALAFEKHGLYEEAEAALQKGLELSPGNVILLSSLAGVRGRQGRPADAERIRVDVEEVAARRYVPFIHRAIASAGCGDMERFYQQMDQALDERELAVPVFLMDRRLDFQADPRYHALLRRINLE